MLIKNKQIEVDGCQLLSLSATVPVLLLLQQSVQLFPEFPLPLTTFVVLVLEQVLQTLHVDLGLVDLKRESLLVVQEVGKDRILLESGASD